MRPMTNAPAKVPTDAKTLDAVSIHSVSKVRFPVSPEAVCGPHAYRSIDLEIIDRVRLNPVHCACLAEVNGATGNRRMHKKAEAATREPRDDRDVLDEDAENDDLEDGN
jgi:hypothetical protein